MACKRIYLYLLDLIFGSPMFSAALRLRYHPKGSYRPLLLHSPKITTLGISHHIVSTPTTLSDQAISKLGINYQPYYQNQNLLFSPPQTIISKRKKKPHIPITSSWESAYTIIINDGVSVYPTLTYLVPRSTDQLPHHVQLDLPILAILLLSPPSLA